MFCKNCGQTIDDNATFCDKCGAKVEAAAPVQPNPNAKSKLVAGLLGIFLGGLGIHNFYLGYTGKAIAQILLSCIGVGAIWGLIEGILILCGSTITTDANGVPLKD